MSVYSMAIIDNPVLYERAKAIADSKYAKPSAYKSGFIVKTYKSMGGTYTDDKKPKNLKRWYEEDWKDIGNKEYPIYRPTKRVNKETPLLASEIDPTNLKQQIELKQKIKGTKNLPKFIGGAISKAIQTRARKMIRATGDDYSEEDVQAKAEELHQKYLANKEKASKRVEKREERARAKEHMITIPVLPESPDVVLPRYYAVEKTKNVKYKKKNGEEVTKVEKSYKLVNPLTKQRNIAERKGVKPITLKRKDVDGVEVENTVVKTIPLSKFVPADQKKAFTYNRKREKYDNRGTPAKDRPDKSAFTTKERGRPELLPKNIYHHQDKGTSKLNEKLGKLRNPRQPEETKEEERQEEEKDGYEPDYPDPPAPYRHPTDPRPQAKKKAGRPKKYQTAEEAKKAKFAMTVESNKRRRGEKRDEKTEGGERDAMGAEDRPAPAKIDRQGLVEYYQLVRNFAIPTAEALKDPPYPRTSVPVNEKIHKLLDSVTDALVQLGYKIEEIPKTRLKQEDFARFGVYLKYGGVAMVRDGNRDDTEALPAVTKWFNKQKAILRKMGVTNLKGSGITSLDKVMPKFVKGSQEARDHMAKIRAMRGSKGGMLKSQRNYGTMAEEPPDFPFYRKKGYTLITQRVALDTKLKNATTETEEAVILDKIHKLNQKEDDLELEQDRQAQRQADERQRRNRLNAQNLGVMNNTRNIQIMESEDFVESPLEDQLEQIDEGLPILVVRNMYMITGTPIPYELLNRYPVIGTGIIDNLKSGFNSAVGAVVDTGKQLVGKAKQFGNTFSQIITGSTDYSPSVRKILNEQGNNQIKSIVVGRTPVQQAITMALNAVSQGGFQSNQDRLNYDKLFHLFSEITLDNGVQVRVEKNEVITMTIGFKQDADTERQEVPITKAISFRELLENARSKMKGKFFAYDSANNNCQDFIMALLQGSGLGTQENYEFIKQNTKQLFEKIPRTRALAKQITNLGQRINIAMSGGKISSNSMPKFAKGSQEARDHMARIRQMRGKGTGKDLGKNLGSNLGRLADSGTDKLISMMGEGTGTKLGSNLAGNFGRLADSGTDKLINMMGTGATHIHHHHYYGNSHMGMEGCGTGYGQGMGKSSAYGSHSGGTVGYSNAGQFGSVSGRGFAEDLITKLRIKMPTNAQEAVQQAQILQGLTPQGMLMGQVKKMMGRGGPKGLNSFTKWTKAIGDFLAPVAKPILQAGTQQAVNNINAYGNAYANRA